MWQIKLLNEKDEPVLFTEPPFAGQEVVYFVPATATESVIYAAKKRATRDGVDHANSEYHWTEPEQLPGRVLIG
jgi:hypothetical protein